MMTALGSIAVFFLAWPLGLGFAHLVREGYSWCKWQRRINQLKKGR